MQQLWQMLHFCFFLSTNHLNYDYNYVTKQLDWCSEITHTILRYTWMHNRYTCSDELLGFSVISMRQRTPLLSLTDWYTMSCPSWFLLAIVNTLWGDNFCSIASVKQNQRELKYTTQKEGHTIWSGVHHSYWRYTLIIEVFIKRQPIRVISIPVLIIFCI